MRSIEEKFGVEILFPIIDDLSMNDTSRVENKANPSFAGRLETCSRRFLKWFNNKMVHTHAGQRADEKLTELVEPA